MMIKYQSRVDGKKYLWVVRKLSKSNYTADGTITMKNLCTDQKPNHEKGEEVNVNEPESIMSLSEAHAKVC